MNYVDEVKMLRDLEIVMTSIPDLFPFLLIIFMIILIREICEDDNQMEGKRRGGDGRRCCLYFLWFLFC